MVTQMTAEIPDYLILLLATHFSLLPAVTNDFTNIAGVLTLEKLSMLIGNLKMVICF